MKKLLVGLISMVVLLMMATANAASMKIAVVNMQQVFHKTPQAEQIKKSMQKRFGPRQKRIISMQKALQANVQKLRKNRSVMSAKSLKKLQQKILAEQRTLQKTQMSFQQELMKAQNTAMQSLLKKVKTAIDHIAKKRKFDVVLTTESVAYANDSLDITSRVIKALS